MKIIKSIIFIIFILLGLTITFVTEAKASTQPLLVEKLKTIGNSKQVVIVTSKGFNSASAKIQAFEKVNGAWRQILNPTFAVIGRNGFSKTKVEGDGKSPVGKFTFGTGFGKYSNP